MSKSERPVCGKSFCLRHRAPANQPTALRKNLSLEEAMIYCLTTEARGLTVPQIAYVINRNRLHVRKDGEPVTEKQIWAAFFRHPEVFVWEGGIMHLLM